MTTTAVNADPERQQRGLVIAATMPIQRDGDMFSVPSQGRAGKYRVDGSAKTCSCPDFELRQTACKHVYAVEFVLRRETTVRPSGETTVTETAAVRVTYAQNWPQYNKAQVSEKEHFCRLLHDLTATVPTPAQQGAGRRRTPLSDMIFAAAFKVYSGFSGRRFQTDLRNACDAGMLTRVPAYNTVFDVMQLEALTPILHDMVTATAKPLAALETQFAVDSTGLGTECFYRHYSAKYGKDRERRDFLKLHASVGTRTNVIAAVSITDRNCNDSPELKPLAEQTARDFEMKELSADKAYSSHRNLELVEQLGATPFIAFKSNATPEWRSHKRPPSRTWAKLFHYFELNRDEFLTHYHRRSNVETTFSMLKRVVGDTLRSKTRVAQVNEALMMVLCHNIRCLIHEAYELGIAPMLEQYACPAIQEPARQLVPVP